MGKAAVLGILGAIAALLIKKTNPEMAVAVVMASGAALLLAALDPLKQVVTALSTLGQSSGLPEGTLSSAMKLTGLSLVAHFGAQTCRDAQQEGLAQKVEFFGRMALLALMIPALTGVMALVAQLAP